MLPRHTGPPVLDLVLKRPQLPLREPRGILPLQLGKMLPTWEDSRRGDFGAHTEFLPTSCCPIQMSRAIGALRRG